MNVLAAGGKVDQVTPVGTLLKKLTQIANLRYGAEGPTPNSRR